MNCTTKLPAGWWTTSTSSCCPPSRALLWPGGGARKLRSKSVRSLLTYAHYRFQQFLVWKAWQSGKDVVLVNEAYTSKTCSWSGEIILNLGGRQVVAGSDGVRVNRDINGARGIFLRALGDTPALREAAQEHIGDYAVSVS